MKSILFLGALESKRKWIPCQVACKNTLNPQMADLMHQHQHQQHTIQFKITIRFYGNENCIQVVLNLSPRLIQIHGALRLEMDSNQLVKTTVVQQMKTNSYQAIDCIYLNYCLITADKN